MLPGRRQHLPLRSLHICGSGFHRFRQRRRFLFAKPQCLLDPACLALARDFREDFLVRRQVGLHVVSAFSPSPGDHQETTFLEGLFHMPRDPVEVGAVRILSRIVESGGYDQTPRFRAQLRDIPVHHAGQFAFAGGLVGRLIQLIPKRDDPREREVAQTQDATHQGRERHR